MAIDKRSPVEVAARPFAEFGCEKMIYDVRMGPQALRYNDVIYIVYQANADGPEAHPHIVTYDLGNAYWSEPVRIGTVDHYDHHFAPVMWFDDDGHIHVLYNCHVVDGGTHMISGRPESIDEWREGPEIAGSISYPRLHRIEDGTLLLYYRTFGHMGYWTYRTSEDGGYTWTGPDIPPFDFDHLPLNDSDTWAGTYQSVCPSKDGRSLHVAFVYWDEKRVINPLYNRRFGNINRHHFYYLRLDIPSGELYTIDGELVEAPVTRSRAERCKVWDTGYRLSNMPSIILDDDDNPSFMLPVSDETPWDCQFHFIKREGGEWTRQPVVRTNHTWAGSHMVRGVDGELTAYLVTGDTDGESIIYGGGEVGEWRSTDEGSSWRFTRKLVPEPGLLYNNPRPVELASGGELDGYLVFYGWEGPGSIQQGGGSDSPNLNRGRAYLWHDGKWL